MPEWPPLIHQQSMIFCHLICHLFLGKSVEEVYVVAKYDYEAQGSQELDIKKSERLILLDDSKHWWKVQNSVQQAGFVPSNYVKREKASLFDSIRKRVRKKSEGGGAKEGRVAERGEGGGGGAQVAGGGGVAVVRYAYEAQQADEVSLAKGGRVRVLEKSSDGWWKGESGGRVGWFPSNYVQEEEEEAAAATYQNVLQGNDLVVALYAFASQSDEELSFEKGEQLEVVERPPNDPDWWRAQNRGGQIGLVPKNYLQVVAPNSPQNGQEGDRPWFVGSITRSDCDRMLNELAEDGDFVIRESETNVSRLLFNFVLNRKKNGILYPSQNPFHFS